MYKTELKNVLEKMTECNEELIIALNALENTHEEYLKEDSINMAISKIIYSLTRNVLAYREVKDILDKKTDIEF